MSAQRYTEEFKVEAVNQVLDRGRSKSCQSRHWSEPASAFRLSRAQRLKYKRAKWCICRSRGMRPKRR